MAKKFELVWILERFSGQTGFFTKHMFGCLAAYVRGQLVMILAENHDDPHWSGILLPTDRERQPALTREFPALKPHPVLPKWLYLPVRNAAFEELALKLATRIAQGDPRIGVIPRPKRRKKRQAKAAK